MAAVTPFDLASLLGVLQVGRDPSAQTHAAPNELTAPPRNAADGAPLLDSVTALVAVDCRENVGYRTARITIPTLSIGDTFTVTIDSNNVVYDSTGDADLDEVVAGIASAINADGTVGAIVEATAVQASDDDETAGTRDSVRIRGLAAADFTIDVSDDGTSVVEFTADPNTCTADVFVQRTRAPDTPANLRWRKTKTQVSVDEGGYLDRWNVAGLSRLYVQLSAIDGPAGDGAGVTLRTPDVEVAPCIRET